MVSQFQDAITVAVLRYMLENHYDTYRLDVQKNLEASVYLAISYLGCTGVMEAMMSNAFFIGKTPLEESWFVGIPIMDYK